MQDNHNTERISGELVSRWDNGAYVNHQPHERAFFAEVRARPAVVEAELREHGWPYMDDQDPTQTIEEGKPRNITAAESHAIQRRLREEYNGPTQDADGWTHPDWDAYLRKHAPEIFGDLPTVAEFRQELRASTTGPKKPPTKVDTDALIARRQRGRR